MNDTGEMLGDRSPRRKGYRVSEGLVSVLLPLSGHADWLAS